jgi:sterol desaturase/sphingolipid hydroxylase (fatty acid hydroxylase superfamily)
LESVEKALQGVLWPLTRLFNVADPFSLVSLLGAAIIAAVFILRKDRSAPRAGFREFARVLLPPALLSHPSTLLDAKVYLVNGFLFGTAIGSWIIASELWRGWTALLLGKIFGAPVHIFAPPWLTQILASLLGIFALDFGYYVVHWLAHHTVLLWRFHRQHHSAVVLTPLTGQREHPVEALLFANVMAFCVGASNAALIQAIGPSANPYLLLDTNFLLLIFYLTLQHLRHSHVWLTFTGPLGYIFQSPAHHQLHHSTDPVHHNKNLGFSLSVFDAMFGTLLVPGSARPTSFGLEGEPVCDNVSDFYFRPFESQPPPAERRGPAGAAQVR